MNVKTGMVLSGSLLLALPSKASWVVYTIGLPRQLDSNSDLLADQQQ